MNVARKFLVGGVIAVAAAACLEPYAPPGTDQDVSFLVVDGFLSSTSGNVSVRLARATPVNAGEPSPAETNASVTVEEADGTGFALHEDSAGYYSQQGLPVNASTQYRLHIRTVDGAEYISDNVPLLSTPPIDSVTWKVQDDAVVVSVNTHDPGNKSIYYMWTYDETYEYVAPYYSGIKVVNGQVTFRGDDEQIYRCWRTDPSTRILINSTLRLSEDRVSDFALTTIPDGDKRLGVKYTILVKQRTLTAQAYTFWQDLQKTTETVGGLFDPLPSQVTGNVHRVGNSSEPVLGYFSAGEETQARIYIRWAELPPTFKDPLRYPNCMIDSVGVNSIGSLGNSVYLLSSYGQPVTIGYTVATGSCANCTLSGGQNKPPVWWK